MPPTCSACRSARLEPWLQVGGDAGEQGLIPTTDAFGTALSDLVRCADCGHGQLATFPAEAVLAEAYGEAESEAYVEEDAGQRETARRALERIEAQVGTGTLLDLGCWVGFLLAEAKDRGWETLGVEPSRFASDFARDRLGLDVRTQDLFTAELPEGHFDEVVLGDVIEHLPEPDVALDRVARLLRPGGVVYMALPDAGSRLACAMGKRWWSVIPTHVQYFTRGSMRTLLERRGWTPRAFGTDPKAFTVRYYLERIGGYSPPVAKALVAAAEKAARADRMWAPDFRDRMWVTAGSPGTTT